MNRRDTIIVASLVNLVLVLVLFTTAKRTDKKNTDLTFAPLPAKFVEVVPTPVEKIQDKVEKKIEKTVVETVPQKVVKEETTLAKAVETKVASSVVSSVPTSQPVPAPKPQPVAKSEVPTPVETKMPAIQKETNKKEYTTVVVKKGDFLERIAKANHTSVAVLMQLNDLSSTQLKIGQTLKVPVVAEKQEENKNTQVRVASQDDYYTVREGDSPWSIALRHSIRLEELLKLNDLDEQKARKIRPGDQLRIR